MNIYLVETRMQDLRARFRNVWAVRRAIVVAYDDDSAVTLVERGVKGEEVFSAQNDEGRFSRPSQRPAFDVFTCTVKKIGDAVAEDTDKGYRILAWELVPPAPDPEETQEEPDGSGDLEDQGPSEEE